MQVHETSPSPCLSLDLTNTFWFSFRFGLKSYTCVLSISPLVFVIVYCGVFSLGEGVILCLVQMHEKVSTDLSVVPENEPLDSDTEAEKNLMERIKSIKQEK